MMQASSHRKYIAVIGASPDRKKFGNKCVRAYARAGWRVYPIHPIEEEIEGFEAYPSLRHLPTPVDRVSLYLPPTRGIEVLEEIQKVQPKELWLNPGTESPEILAKAKKAQAQRGPRLQHCGYWDLAVGPARVKGRANSR